MSDKPSADTEVVEAQTLHRDPSVLRLLTRGHEQA